MNKIVIIAAALIAAPAFAQSAPPAPPSPPGAGAPDTRVYVMRKGGGRFEGVSPEGRAVLRDALRPADREQDRAAVRAARERINALMAADRLDVGALRSAMTEERRLTDTMQVKRQEAMLAAIQRLSAADRKAFAAAADKGRDRMMARAGEWREWARRYRDGRQLPPPPPPPAPPAARI